MKPNTKSAATITAGMFSSVLLFLFFACLWAVICWGMVYLCFYLPVRFFLAAYGPENEGLVWVVWSGCIAAGFAYLTLRGLTRRRFRFPWV